jgi:predicted nucleotidyltransferase
MIIRKEIRRFVRTLAKEFEPERVILFGSYADGTPTRDSDVDLMVIMRHKGDSVDQALAIRRQLDCPFPLDLIVKTPSEARKRLKRRDMFVTRVFRDGDTLYEKQRQRMD